jgi:hypothetical protein
MSSIIRSIAATAVAATALFVPASAHANVSGFLQSNISPFGEPIILQLVSQSGQWRLKDGTTQIPITYNAEVSGPQRYLLSIDIQVQHMAKGDGALHELRRDLYQDAASGNTNLSMTKSHLLPMEKVGQDLCASHNSPGKKTTATFIPLTMWVHWHNGSVGYSVGTHSTPIYGNIPATIECGPNPTARPGGLVAEKGDLRVQSIDLRYMTVVGDVTRPNPATQCKRTRLSVTLKANQVGPVRFRLNTKIGAGPTQVKAVDAWASHDGKGFFVANYQEWITVDKSTSVQAMAEDLINPVGLTTPWKQIALHCTGAGGGGFASNPGNANPDNGQLPTKPKQPKRVFDGPNTLTPGAAKPTHGSSTKPVIAPATIKTAPAGNTPPRASKHIGKARPQAGL